MLRFFRDCPGYKAFFETFLLSYINRYGATIFTRLFRRTFGLNARIQFRHPVGFQTKLFFYFFFGSKDSIVNLRIAIFYYIITIKRVSATWTQTWLANLKVESDLKKGSSFDVSSLRKIILSENATFLLENNLKVFSKFNH